jgi:hypothetical protein
LERGDKYDKSVMYLLSTLPGETFWVEKKGGGWKVTIGRIVGAESEAPAKQPTVVAPPVPPKPKPKAPAKPLGKPKTKKVKR